jgi:hypothetical protein
MLPLNRIETSVPFSISLSSSAAPESNQPLVLAQATPLNCPKSTNTSSQGCPSFVPVSHPTPDSGNFSVQLSRLSQPGRERMTVWFDALQKVDGTLIVVQKERNDEDWVKFFEKNCRVKQIWICPKHTYPKSGFIYR